MTIPSDEIILSRSGLQSLRSIKRLNLEGVGFTEVGESIAKCENLEDLSLAKNRVISLQGIGYLSKLRRLDVSGNCLKNLAGIEGLSGLEELYVQGNAIENWDRDVRRFLLDLPRLRIVYFKSRTGNLENVLCQSSSYPREVLESYSQIQILDGERVKLRKVAYVESLEDVQLQEDDIDLPNPTPWTFPTPSSPFRSEILLEDSLLQGFKDNLSGCKALLIEADSRLEQTH